MRHQMVFITIEEHISNRGIERNSAMIEKKKHSHSQRDSSEHRCLRWDEPRENGSLVEHSVREHKRAQRPRRDWATSHGQYECSRKKIPVQVDLESTELNWIVTIMKKSHSRYLSSLRSSRTSTSSKHSLDHSELRVLARSTKLTRFHIEDLSELQRQLRTRPNKITHKFHHSNVSTAHAVPPSSPEQKKLTIALKNSCELKSLSWLCHDLCLLRAKRTYNTI